MKYTKSKFLLAAIGALSLYAVNVEGMIVEGTGEQALNPQVALVPNQPAPTNFGWILRKIADRVDVSAANVRASESARAKAATEKAAAKARAAAEKAAAKTKIAAEKAAAERERKDMIRGCVCTNVSQLLKNIVYNIDGSNITSVSVNTKIEIKNNAQKIYDWISNAIVGKRRFCVYDRKNWGWFADLFRETLQDINTHEQVLRALSETSSTVFDRNVHGHFLNALSELAFSLDLHRLALDIAQKAPKIKN